MQWALTCIQLRLGSWLFRINFEKTNTERIENDDIVIAIYKNPEKVHILDEEKIPEEFFQVKETKLLNKDKLKESLKNGEDIPGCELIQEKRISIK